MGLISDNLSELKKTLFLAFPIVVGQLSGTLMSMVDAAMVGRGVGTVAQAALGFAGNFVHAPMVAIFGFSTAQSVLIAQAYGREKKGEAETILRHGMFMMSGTGLIVSLIMIVLAFNLHLFNNLGQEPIVVEEARVYVIFLSLAFVGIHLFAAFRVYCEAQDRPWLPLAVMMGGVVLNIFLNWVFIFGNLGFPAMGLAGAGLATMLSPLAALSVLLTVLHHSAKFDFRLPMVVGKVSTAIFRRIFNIGGPTSLQIFFEIVAFNAAAIMMGTLGAEQLAAHHISIQVAAFSFMIPLGTSFAVAIRIGQASGRNDLAAVKRIGIGSIGAISVWMLLAATVILVFRHEILQLFSDDPAVIALAMNFLLMTALFQLFDGVQVTSAGALRGLQDVKIPTLITLVAYWGVALPGGWALAFPLDLGGIGIWIGLAAGLALAAVLLSTRFIVASGSLMRTATPVAVEQPTSAPS